MEERFFRYLEILITSRSRQVDGVHIDLPNNPCIEWTGLLTKSGYGDLHFKFPSGRKLHTTAHKGGVYART